ncbi:MAG: flagellar assembly protein FliH [Rhodospirillaceae bacterium]
MFDVSFDADEGRQGRRLKETVQVAVPPPPPPPPSFSVGELEAARKKAYVEGMVAGKADGYRKGREEAEGERQAALADALIRLADGVATLVADRDDLNAARTGQPLQIAMAIIGKLFPGLIRRHGPEELEEFITACLNEAIDEPRLKITINDGLLEELRPIIENLAEQRGFAGRLVILGSPAQGMSDARIEWAEGGAERNTSQLLADIEQTALRMLGET